MEESVWLSYLVLKYQSSALAMAARGLIHSPSPLLRLHAGPDQDGRRVDWRIFIHELRGPRRERRLDYVDEPKSTNDKHAGILSKFERAKIVTSVKFKKAKLEIDNSMGEAEAVLAKNLELLPSLSSRKWNTSCPLIHLASREAESHREEGRPMFHPSSTSSSSTLLPAVNEVPWATSLRMERSHSKQTRLLHASHFRLLSLRSRDRQQYKLCC